MNTNKLKFWRLERNLSQYELAGVTNPPVSRAIIQLVELGLRALEIEEAQSLATALGINLSQLIGKTRGENDK